MQRSPDLLIHLLKYLVILIVLLQDQVVLVSIHS